MAVNPDINSWLEEELREQYQHDRSSVDPDWKQVFEQNGSPELAHRNGGAARPVGPPAYKPADGEELAPLRGAAARIAENMAASVYVPLATSQRTVPVKVIDENRRLINNHRSLLRQPKVSYTHLIGWAIVRSVKSNPTLNTAFAEKNGEPFRVLHKEINLGIAVDVAGKGGSRSLVVPNIKDAGAIEFSQYVAAFDELVARARAGKLALADFQGTTISITNPGTVGTLASIPRLMPGQ